MESFAGRALGPQEQYRLIEPLGRGGMAVVFRAEHVTAAWRRPVAVKVIDPALSGQPDFLRRFYQEAQTCARLEHPHIVPVYDFGEHEGVCYLVMRLIPGGALNDRFRAAGGQPWAPARVLPLARQILGALDHAHARDVVHRDVKPSNVLLDPDGQTAFLTDFGIARMAEGGPGLTQPGLFVGTPEYAAPEQVEGLAVDGRADLYAFGIVLYELLAGRVPYTGGSPMSIAFRHVNGPLPPPREINPTISPAIDAVLRRALARSPDERYPTGAALVEALAAATEGAAPAAPLPAPAATVVMAAGGPATIVPTNGPPAGGESLVQPAERPNNLPVDATPFVGREREVAEVREQLERAEVRLLTLTGPGGTGKTRLSLRVAARLLDSFEDGVFFVQLGALSDHSLVPADIAQTLGVKETPGQPLVVQLEEHLRERQILLVLDNFEQILPAAPLVSRLLAAAPRLKVLVTSRSALRVYGEHELPIAPMELPDIERPSTRETVAQCEAVQLFIGRARAVRPDFELTHENCRAVAECCHRLDGLPLALELAAARIRLLSPEAMLGRLERRLPLLTGGARDLPARQQTLRGAIQWSYDLLDPAEQTLFRRLAAFTGGCTFDAAEVVCAAAGDLEIDLFEGLTSLVEKSMVRSEEQEGDARFRMLSTIREYGLEQLAASGELEATQRAHLDFYLALAEQAEPQLVGREQYSWLERLEREQDNFRAALEASFGLADGVTGPRLSGALYRYWLMRARLSEGWHWLEAALAQSAEAPPAVRIKVLNAAGGLAIQQGDYLHAGELLEQSVALCRQTGSSRELALGLSNLATAVGNQGDTLRAKELYQEGLAAARSANDQRLAAIALANLGVIARIRGDREEAARSLTDGLALRRQMGDRRGAAVMLNFLGLLSRDQGDYAAAKARLDESLTLFRELEDRWGIATALNGLAGTALERGELDRAEELADESLTLFDQVGDSDGVGMSLLAHAAADHRRGNQARAIDLSRRALAAFWKHRGRLHIPGCLEVLGAALAETQPEQAARLYGAAEALHEAVGAAPQRSAWHEPRFEAIRAALGEDGFEFAWQLGRLEDLDQVIASELAEVPAEPAQV